MTTTEKEDGRQYSNLAGVAKLPKGFEAPAATLEPIVYDIDENDPADIAKLPEWIQKKITDSESDVQRQAKQFAEIDDSDGELPF